MSNGMSMAHCALLNLNKSKRMIGALSGIVLDDLCVSNPFLIVKIGRDCVHMRLYDTYIPIQINSDQYKIHIKNIEF